MPTAVPLANVQMLRRFLQTAADERGPLLQDTRQSNHLWWENVDRAWPFLPPIARQWYRRQSHESLPDKTRHSPSPEDAGVPMSVLSVLLSFLPAFRSCKSTVSLETERFCIS